MKKSELIGVRVTPEVKEWLQSIADREDRSISYIVNRIIETRYKEETVEG